MAEAASGGATTSCFVQLLPDDIRHQAIDEGTRLVTAGADNQARIWDAQTGRTVGILDGHLDQVQSAVFSPDGDHIVTTSFDKTARIWRVFPTTRKLIDQAKQAVPRCLTLDQRKAISLGGPPPSWCTAMHKWPYSAQN
jgi:WD40 repeat protein